MCKVSLDEFFWLVRTLLVEERIGVGDAISIYVERRPSKVIVTLGAPRAAFAHVMEVDL